MSVKDPLHVSTLLGHLQVVFFKSLCSVFHDPILQCFRFCAVGYKRTVQVGCWLRNVKEIWCCVDEQ